VKNKRLLALTWALLTAACPFVTAQNFLDYLEVIYFSEDGKMVAIKTTGNPDSPVGPVITAGRILILDTSTGNLEESFDVTEGAILGWGADDEKLKKDAEEAWKQVAPSLFVRGINVEAERGRLPPDCELSYRTKLIDQNAGIYELTYYLHHFDTGHTLGIKKIEAWMPEGVEAGTVEVIYPLPKGNGYLALDRTPPKMEFDTGPPIMAEFYNGVGFAYYKRKDYEAADRYFNVSYGFDPWYPKATYNIACIRALRGDANGAIEYLNKLYRDEPSAMELLGQVDTDSDFNGIRKDPRFQAFMKKVRPR